MQNKSSIQLYSMRKKIKNCPSFDRVFPNRRHCQNNIIYFLKCTFSKIIPPIRDFQYIFACMYPANESRPSLRAAVNCFSMKSAERSSMDCARPVSPLQATPTNVPSSFSQMCIPLNSPAAAVSPPPPEKLFMH